MSTAFGLDVETADLEGEDWIGGGELTLPSIMAISGAALSPLMGRLTLPAYRFLMAIMNVRLGVWLRNRASQTTRPSDSPLPPAPEAAMRTDGRSQETLPNRGEDPPQIVEDEQTVAATSGLLSSVRRGWREPGSWYVLKEALGLASSSGRYVYVTDGGHWENLGLVELLRRRCSHLLVFDASGGSALGDVGRALAIARSELGVEIQLDPTVTEEDPDSGLATTPIAVGEVTYPNRSRAVIYYARNTLWSGAPTDLLLYASRSEFPQHRTVNQFLSGEAFDAYRTLGWAVAGSLVEAANLPPDQYDEGATTQTSAAPSIID